MKKFSCYSVGFLFFILECCYGADPWGIWVSSLPQPCVEVHYQLAQQEMNLTRDTKDSTNHALFQLSLYNRETHERIRNFKQPTDPQDPGRLFSFPSGGYVFDIDPDPGPDKGKLESRQPTFWKLEKIKTSVESAREKTISTIQRDWPKYDSFIKSSKTEGSKGEKKQGSKEKEVDSEGFYEKVDSLCATLQGLKELFEDVQEIEAGIKLVDSAQQRWIGALACNRKPIKAEGADPGRHLYDSEQLVMAYVDHLMNLLQSPEHPDNKFLATNNKPYYFVVHLHTLRDMCPFCLYSLHIKIGEWNELLHQTFGERVSLLAMASSRLEYTSIEFSFLSRLYPSYRGTMRSIGTHKPVLTEEELLELGQQGLVVQLPLDPFRLYNSPPSESTAGTVSALPSGNVGSSSEEL